MEPKGPALKCKPTVTKEGQRKTISTSRGNGEIDRYRVVDYCPEENSDSELASKCSGENQSSLEEYLWVSENKTGLTFQNRFCAECNRIKDIVTWQFLTDCSQIIFQNLSLINDASFFPDACSIINVVPDSVKDTVERFRCFLSHFSTCNETGLWQHYDMQIEIACGMYTSNFIFFTKASLHVPIYKNVFCFVCNEANTADTVTLCPVQEVERRRQTIPFTVLIDFDVVQTLKNTDTSTAICNIDEVHDTFMVSSVIYPKYYQKYLFSLSYLP